MNTLFQLILSLSVSGSLLILIFSILFSVLKGRVTKTWQYYIWLIVIARLLLPITPQHSLTGYLFSLPAVSSAPASATQSPPASTSAWEGSALPTIEDGAVPAFAPGNKTSRITAASRPKTGAYLPLFWGCIALILFFCKLTAYRSFLQYMRVGCVPISEPTLLNRYFSLCVEIGVKKPPELCINPLAASPMLIGIRKPCIVLPEQNMLQTGFEEILAHELMHLKHQDIYYKWLMQLTVCIHWFNPLVHLAARKLNHACELACDEAVLDTLCSSKKKYGDILLSSVRPGAYKSSIVPLTLSEDAKHLKERLGAIMEYSGKSRKKSFLAAALTTMLCCGAISLGAYASVSFTTASGQKNVPTAAKTETTSAIAKNINANTETPEGTLQVILKALQNADLKTFDQYSDNRRGNRAVLFGPASNMLSFTADSTTKALLSNLSWEIGSIRKTGDTAMIETKITNTDFSTVIEKMVVDSIEHLDKNSSELEDYLAAARGKNITLSLTVTVNRTDGVWKVHIDQAFTNAITGNMLDGGLTNSAQAHIEKAIDKMMDTTLSGEITGGKTIRDFIVHSVHDAIADAGIEKDIQDAMAGVDIKKDIQDAMADVDIKKDIQDAMADVDIKKDIQDAMADVDIKKDIQDAMADVNIKKEIEQALNGIDIQQDIMDALKETYKDLF